MMQSSWTWAAACRRGLSHEKADLRLQDAFKCFVGPSESRPLVIVVSDGAGSAPLGGEAASLICRTVTVFTRKHFSSTDSLPSDELLQGWLDDIRARLSAAAERRNLEARDLAATLIVFISSGADSVVLHVGDGCAVIKDADSSAWIALGWPFHGEYASTTAFVTDEPRPNSSIVRHRGGISAVSVFSDGLERLALDLKAHQPFTPFFERMIAPVVGSASLGKDVDLSSKLDTFLGSDDINSRSDDDKTLVLAVRR